MVTTYNNTVIPMPNTTIAIELTCYEITITVTYWARERVDSDQLVQRGLS